jgi:hypothetical protein
LIRHIDVELSLPVPPDDYFLEDPDSDLTMVFEEYVTDYVDMVCDIIVGAKDISIISLALAPHTYIEAESHFDTTIAYHKIDSLLKHLGTSNAGATSNITFAHCLHRG